MIYLHMLNAFSVIPYDFAKTFIFSASRNVVCNVHMWIHTNTRCYY